MLLATRASERSLALSGGLSASRVVPSKRAQRHDLVPAGAQVIDDPRQRLDGLRAVPAGVVQKDDAAVAALLFDPLEDDIRAGPGPVLGVDVLHDGEIIEVLRDTAAA